MISPACPRLPRKSSYTIGPLILGLLACLGATVAVAATSLSQHGITWTFDQDYPSGQFANGDHWVVGPVRIVSINPQSTTSNGRTINGSMINPAVGKPQGYDSATYASYGASYSGNVALGVSSSSPLTVVAGSSLISSISNPTAGARPQITSAAILTVLPSAAPAGSFRPPYTGTDKTLRWNKSQLKYSLLRSLPKVANTPPLATVEAEFERPWLEHNPDWTGRYIHPSGNMPDYGRDMANALADGLLSLHLDYTAAAKEKLLIRLVQYGIDVYGVAKAGGVWEDLGGHNQGRKMPMVLAGMVLGDSNILAMANGAKKIFQEDRQTWYVATADVGRELYSADGRPREAYVSADVGIAEWGEQHTRQPSRDGRNWDAYYRNIVGHSILGHVLTARLMNAEAIWAWAPAFDYADRYWANEKTRPTGAGNAIRPFVHAMWSAFRGAPLTLGVSPATDVPSSDPASGSETITTDETTGGPTASDTSTATGGATGSSSTSPSGSAAMSPSSRLINVSVRSVARGNANPLIVGFVVGGSGRSVLIRSIGPSLAELGVTDYLPDPRIDIHATASGTGRVVASNDNWAQAGAGAMQAAFASTGAFSLDGATLDAALTMHAAGAHTVHAGDTEGRNGVALVEVYDLGSELENRIVNLSARNFVGIGDQILIAGFVIRGGGRKRLLIRGIGPGLKAFGVKNVLADPKLEIHASAQSGSETTDTIIAGNDDWAAAGTATLQAAFAATGAFSLTDTASKDAAVVVELEPGIYTVLLSGQGGATGEGMIEVYELP